eukprot:403336328
MQSTRNIGILSVPSSLIKGQDSSLSQDENTTNSQNLVKEAPKVQHELQNKDTNANRNDSNQDKIIINENLEKSENLLIGNDKIIRENLQNMQQQEFLLLHLLEENKLNDSITWFGLQNQNYHNNCFLNVAIQSIWHLTKDRGLKAFVNDLQIKNDQNPITPFIESIKAFYQGIQQTQEAYDKNLIAFSANNIRKELFKVFYLEDLFGIAESSDASEALMYILLIMYSSQSILFQQQLERKLIKIFVLILIVKQGRHRQVFKSKSLIQKYQRLILIGMECLICYSGDHYVAYFRNNEKSYSSANISQNLQSKCNWKLLNDHFVENKTSWYEVVEEAVLSNMIPTVLFYESNSAKVSN